MLVFRTLNYFNQVSRIVWCGLPWLFMFTLSISDQSDDLELYRVEVVEAFIFSCLIPSFVAIQRVGSPCTALDVSNLYAISTMHTEDLSVRLAISVDRSIRRVPIVGTPIDEWYRRASCTVLHCVRHVLKSIIVKLVEMGDGMDESATANGGRKKEICEFG